MSTAATAVNGTASGSPAPATPPAPAAAKRQGEAEILLESGTNELEVLVFGLGEGSFGVNVAKVREVILPVQAVARPNQPPGVIGMFNLRGRILPLIDLRAHLSIPGELSADGGRIIVTEFNGVHAAFRVDRVEQIYRMSWRSVRQVPETGDEHFAITGITEVDNRLVLMLDFESILDQISMEDKLHIDKVENKLGVDRASIRLWLAEDSRFIHNLMRKVLISSGYKNVAGFTNGQQCWDQFQQLRQSPDQLPHALITDIEMPMMDGLALCRRVKEDATFKNIPVILFSSLITEDTRHKGRQVGASDQISKPQLPELVQLVDQWIGGEGSRPAQTAA